MVRKWYAAWATKDWGSLDTLAADDFTFSSAAGDDHISKSAFKAQCWDTQNALIDRFDLQSVLGKGNEVFVKYVCWTKKGKVFRNVEHFTIKGDKIAALECYFGDQAGYPAKLQAKFGAYMNFEIIPVNDITETVRLLGEGIEFRKSI